MSEVASGDGKMKLKDVKRLLDEAVKVTNKHILELAALDKKKVSASASNAPG